LGLDGSPAGIHRQGPWKNAVGIFVSIEKFINKMLYLKNVQNKLIQNMIKQWWS
jgi:hypothetical protein